MIYVGDYFALGFVIMLFLFFLDDKTSFRYMTSAAKLFIGCLLTTALTACVDLFAVHLLNMPGTPLWLNLFANSLYFVSANVATSVIAMFVFTKLLEHTHNDHCYKNARTGLIIVFFVHLAFILANLKTGWLFTIENGAYCRGPLNSFGYLSTVAQMMLVVVCYARNRQNASRAVRRVLLQIFPMVFTCFIVHHIAPSILLNTLVMSLVCVILFLTFVGQRQGVHALTELNDRHRFFAEVDRRIAKKDPFQVYLINIKDFGALNQKYGHLFGDEYLYQFAFSLDKLFRGCMAFHMNGTVFALVMRYTYQNLAEEQCNTLLGFLEKGIQCENKQVAANYVAAHYVADGTETTAAKLYEVMEYASTKAYSLKNRYIRCSKEILQELERVSYLQERLKTIDSAHGYEVWFQPIKCLESGKFCSMEALIRLREPDGSLISPGEFIPLAEQTGHINSITWFVLEETCRLLKYKPELKDISVSINLPVMQMLEKGFVPRFTSVVDQARISHHQICIEFTERSVFENFKQVKAVMEELTSNDFSFYLDDFGSGYSNFNCILQLPFQIIKLDRSLLRSERSGSGFVMIRTLTRLLHDMDLVVVAEGAETAMEVKLLAEQGVDRIQGFALAVPMPTDKLIQFYREHPVTLM